MLRTHGRLPFSLKVIGTICCIVLFRLLSSVPLPYINTTLIQQSFVNNGSYSMLNILTGGNLSRMSVAALGVSPFISASIALQIFGAVIPRLQAAQKDGFAGRKLLQRLSFIVSILISIGTTVGLVRSYQNLGLFTSDAWYVPLIVGGIMVCTSAVLALVTIVIDERFFGRGVSVFLLAGILSSVPGSLYQTFKTVSASALFGVTWLPTVLLICGLIALWLFVCWILHCEQELPLAYSKKAVGDTVEGGVLPLQLLVNSIMPVVFASMCLSLPSVLRLIVGTDVAWLRVFDTSAWFKVDDLMPSLVGIPLYICLIFLFSKYSQAFLMNEVEISEALRRAGAVIVGVVPGHDTEVFLQKHIKRLRFWGAVCLCVISFVPILASGLFGLSSLGILGTSLILVVSIIRDLYYDFRVEVRSGRYVRLISRMVSGKKSNDSVALLWEGFRV